MITLATPDARLVPSYLLAHAEFEAVGEGHRDGDGVWVEKADDGYPGVTFTREDLATPEGAERFAELRRSQAREETPRPTGHVPCTFLWIVDDAEPDTYLGSLAIRHRLTPFLLEVGGHIGYSVRPSARRRGVATAALREALPLARALGIDPALVTCDDDNTGSRRVIEANGGVLEDVRGAKRRYWVSTRARATGA
jgi:predicted acetyltransferase